MTILKSKQTSEMESEEEKASEEEDGVDLEQIIKALAGSPHKTTLDLSSMDLEHLPLKVLVRHEVLQYRPQQITSLCVDYNDLHDIPSEIKHLHNLTSFSINGNNLQELPDHVCLLHKLQVLSFNENELSCLPEHIGNLTALKRLSAVGNQLACLPDSFSSLESLAEAYLDENKLVSLPGNFGKLRKLEILELSNNRLTYLPQDIGDAEFLKIVNVNYNKLDQLPESLCKLQNLETLDVSNNNLKELPGSHGFSSAKKLKKLYIENNNIKALPAWCGTMLELEELFVSDNALQKEQFDDKFCTNCTKVRILEAGANSMESLSCHFGQLKNLEVVHFGSTISELERSNFQNGNWMKYLPDSFTRLNKLVKANLNENQLGCLPDAFGDLCSLTWLDLGQNMIKRLPTSFCNLVNMEFLQLSKNLLEELPDDIGNFQKLIELRLDNNLVKTIPTSLGKIKGLQALDLFRNQLMEIPGVVFQLKNLTRLDLDQNNFKVSLTEIPKIVPGLRYPHRDPSLKHNWRGKTRVEECNSDVIDYPPSYDGDDQETHEEIDVPWNEQALKMAISRGASFWRSHNDSNEARPVQDHKQTADQDDDDDEWIAVTCNSPPDDEFIKDPCEEDWDEEIAMNELYNRVKFTCEDRKTKTSNAIDAFQSSINRYPPAVQAYSATANYDSFVYKNTKQTPISNYSTQVVNNIVNACIEGQFDDAE